MTETNKRFSFSYFLIKITSRQFCVWGVTTALTGALLLKNGEHTWFLPLIVVWGIVSVLFLCGQVLIDALAKMVEKANLTINQHNTVSASANIQSSIGGEK